MKRPLLAIGVCLLILGVMTPDAHGVGIPIPIVWGSGEKMTDLGELPPRVSRDVAEELGAPVTVAFLYESAHLFYCDLWTWNGRHVLHSGDRYWEPDSTEWQRMIGGDPSAKYGRPILYTIPLLPVLLSLAIAVYVVRKRYFKTDQEKLDALFGDLRYQNALETAFGQVDGEPAEEPITKLDEKRFLDAKNQLIREGIDRQTAESNLRKLADTVIAGTNAQIDAYLALAFDLNQQGEWDQSAEIYSQVISSLPETDDRKAYAQNSLASVNNKRSETSLERDVSSR